jgi:putative ABC transport system substrate-binding protein
MTVVTGQAGEKRMNKTILVWLLATISLTIVFHAEAQQPKKLPRIAYLSANSAAGQTTNLKAFRQGLGELGYVGGKNILIDYRYADAKLDRLPALAAELVALKVEVIVTSGPTATRPAKEATAMIPIVMANDNDPVGYGFVASLARPGGNITGLSTLSAELNGKRLELLKEIVPGLSRVAVFRTSTNPGNAQALKETELAAGALGLKIQYSDIRDPKDIEAAFKAARNQRSDGILALNTPFINTSYRQQLAALAVKNRLPAIYFSARYPEDGGLMSYGVSSADLFRRAATYVDKILKGAKPADLPVEQPTKFEFIINLKAAKQIGLTIPPNVLARADRVIR